MMRSTAACSRTHFCIDCLEPILVGHVDLKHHVEVAFVVGSLVHGHALSAKNDTVSRLDDLAWRTSNVDSATVQMRYEYSREAK